MLLAIAISQLYVEIKDLVLTRILGEILKLFWSEWELRLMVLLSLVLQFLLVYFGSIRKKYTGGCVPIIAISAWLIYLSADWMATLVLSTLLRGSTELGNGLIVFWTPFLLWHLGSPYNITAYSLEDNELWLRHFLGMVFQIGEAIYIYVKFQSNTALNAMALPLFIGGVIKYAERTWALRCASKKQLINYFYTKSTSKNPDESIDNMIRTGLCDLPTKNFVEHPSIAQEVKFLREAYSSFEVFKPLFADLPFQIVKEFHEKMVSLKSSSADKAFNFVRIELEFLYDLLYTKNPIQHRRHCLSLILRSICLLSLVSALIAFSVLLHKTELYTVDTTVTYLLLSGAISLEIISFRMHFWSKWTMLKYAVPRNKLFKLYHRIVNYQLRSIMLEKGIKKMPQHDLIDYFVKVKGSQFMTSVKLIDTTDLLQRFWNSTWKPVDKDLKKFIFCHLKERRPNYKSTEGSKLDDVDNKSFGEVVHEVIKDKYHLLPEDLDECWKMEATDFTRLIFVWHIATALVYYDDLDNHRRGTCDSFIKIGKSLSDYMMHLVLVRPSMLPNGFSETVNKETYDQVQRLFPQLAAVKNLKVSGKEFVAGLLLLPNDSIQLLMSETGALYEGVKFAKQLQSLRGSASRWDDGEKWKMISEVWMEMMVYAASRCTWDEHAQQLKHGGELLTHVSLLVAHLGLSTQVHIREKSADNCSNILTNENRDKNKETLTSVHV